LALRPPTFNLSCNLWHTGATFPKPAGWTPPALPADVASVCQLYFWSKATNTPILFSPGGPPDVVAYEIAALLRLPKLTDVRFPAGQYGVPNAAYGVAEVPAGSGRYYACVSVEDCHKGFPNEYRVAFLCWFHVANFPMG